MVHLSGEVNCLYVQIEMMSMKDVNVISIENKQ